MTHFMVKENFYFTTCAKSIFIVMLSFFMKGTFATYYYCSPEGSMDNDGLSKTSPWGSLETVVSQKQFSGGDIIYLMSGQHGYPVIKTINSSDVTITAAEGEAPVIEKIFMSGASHWILKGLTISTNGQRVPKDPPLKHPVYPLDENSLIMMTDYSTYITIDSCYINSIEDSRSWTKDDWNYKAWNGINHKNTDHVTVRHCYLKNVNFGINNGGGTSIKNTLYEYNTIENFTGDGFRGHGVSTVIQYNTVKTCIATNGNHRDMLQVVGKTTGLIVRGNKFLSFKNPEQPFCDQGCQGLGLFDGMYYEFVIENNIIATSSLHGISIMGAEDCEVMNNTIISIGNTGTWIQVVAHKKGTKSIDNIVRNNLCYSLDLDDNIGEVDHNILMNYNDRYKYFNDYDNMDFSLKLGSLALDVGSDVKAPKFDIDGNPRPNGKAVDVGAYEYSGPPDDSAPTVPADLTVINVTGKSIELEWTPSIDDVGVTGYDIFVNDELFQVIDSASTVIDGLFCNSEFAVKVQAHDYAGNLSGFSNSVDVTTLNECIPVNVAVGKSVSVSGEDPATPAINLLDDNILAESRWSAENFPQEVEIDLNEKFILSSVEIFPYKERAYQFIVEAQTDDGEYIEIMDNSNNTSGGEKIESDIDATARYVKITFTGCHDYSGSWVSVNEIKVFGLPDTASQNSFIQKVKKTSLKLNLSDAVVYIDDLVPSNDMVLSIFDLAGKLMYNQMLANKTGFHHEVNIKHNFQPGIYLIRISGNKKNTVKKIRIN